MTLEHEGLFEDIPLHRCDACSALWLAPESLDRLDDNVNVDASKLDWQPAATAGAYRCPSCPGGYRESNPLLSALALPLRSDTVMYRCARCDGLLLDEPTLNQIRTAVISS
jgi:Zn-finger nucleic acid-binding protein